jgi:hypothetical protein
MRRRRTAVIAGCRPLIGKSRDLHPEPSEEIHDERISGCWLGLRPVANALDYPSRVTRLVLTDTSIEDDFGGDHNHASDRGYLIWTTISLFKMTINMQLARDISSKKEFVVASAAKHHHGI